MFDILEFRNSQVETLVALLTLLRKAPNSCWLLVNLARVFNVVDMVRCRYLPISAVLRN